MTAKEEIAKYTRSTSFGGRQPIKIDPPVARPANAAEARSQIVSIYAENDWCLIEQKMNHQLLGLTAKTLADCDTGELQIILADLEKRAMIIYEKI